MNACPRAASASGSPPYTQYCIIYAACTSAGLCFLYGVGAKVILRHRRGLRRRNSRCFIKSRNSEREDGAANFQRNFQRIFSVRLSRMNWDEDDEGVGSGGGRHQIENTPDAKSRNIQIVLCQFGCETTSKSSDTRNSIKKTEVIIFCAI